MEPIIEKQKNMYNKLKDEFGYKNSMQTPKIKKVVVSVGTGKMTDKNKIAAISDKLAVITGQKPAVTKARMSIASFKLREGQNVGYKVTLNGKAMNGFLDKLLNVALPRTRDFRGIPATSVDEMGNYTLGITDNSIFPETADQDIKDAFGMAITVVTTSKDKEQTKRYLELLGFPFKKEEE